MLKKIQKKNLDKIYKALLLSKDCAFLFPVSPIAIVRNVTNTIFM